MHKLAVLPKTGKPIRKPIKKIDSKTGSRRDYKSIIKIIKNCKISSTVSVKIACYDIVIREL